MPKGRCEAVTKKVSTPRTFGQSHGNDITFEITVHDVPCALIYRKWGQGMVPDVLVRFRHDPRWGIRYSLAKTGMSWEPVNVRREQTYEIQHLPSHHKGVEGAHHLFDAGAEIPEMDVQEIDVGGAKLMKRCVYGEVHRFCAVACVKRFLSDGVVPSFEVCRVLSTVLLICSYWAGRKELTFVAMNN